MKVKYYSDDGLVSGYGDEGKAAVEAHEADPLARFKLPWAYSGSVGGWRNADGAYPTGEDFTAMILLGSKAAPLVQDLVRYGNDSWETGWRGTRFKLSKIVGGLEQALKESISG